jgi:hypothetical protein
MADDVADRAAQTVDALIADRTVSRKDEMAKLTTGHPQKPFIAHPSSLGANAQRNDLRARVPVPRVSCPNRQEIIDRSRSTAIEAPWVGGDSEHRRLRSDCCPPATPLPPAVALLI